MDLDQALRVIKAALELKKRKKDMSLHNLMYKDGTIANPHCFDLMFWLKEHNLKGVEFLPEKDGINLWEITMHGNPDWSVQDVCIDECFIKAVEMQVEKETKPKEKTANDIIQDLHKTIDNIKKQKTNEPHEAELDRELIMDCKDEINKLKGKSKAKARESEEYTIELLVESGEITQEQIDKGWQKVADENGKIGILEAIVELGFVTEDKLLDIRAQQYGLETICLDEYEVPSDVIAQMSEHLAREYNVLPVMFHENILTVAISDPSDLETVDALRFRLKMDIESVVCSKKDLNKYLNKYYGTFDELIDGLLENSFVIESEIEHSRECAVDLLCEKGLLTQEQCDKAWDNVGINGEMDILESIVALGLVDEKTMLETLAERYGLKIMALENYTIPQDVINVMDGQTARMYKVVPVDYHGKTIVVAISDPTNRGFIDELKFILDIDVEYVVASKSDIKAAIDKYYPVVIDEAHIEKCIEAEKKAVDSFKFCNADCGAEAKCYDNLEDAKECMSRLDGDDSLIARMKRLPGCKCEGRLLSRKEIHDAIVEDAERETKKWEKVEKEAMEDKEKDMSFETLIKKMESRGSMNPGTCKHFLGVSNGKCMLDIPYVFIPYKGWQLPCIKESANGLVCDKYAEPTEQELIQSKEDDKKSNIEIHRRLNLVIPLMSKLKTDYKDMNNRGIVECPICKGRMAFSIASCNGHVWLACETQGCWSSVE